MFWLNSNGAVIVNSAGNPIDCDHCPCSSVIYQINYDFATKNYNCTLQGLGEALGQTTETCNEQETAYIVLTRITDDDDDPEEILRSSVGTWCIPDMPGFLKSDADAAAAAYNAQSNYNMQGNVVYQNSQQIQDFDPKSGSAMWFLSYNSDGYCTNQIAPGFVYTYNWGTIMIQENEFTDPSAVGIRFVYFKDQLKNDTTTHSSGSFDLMFNVEYESFPHATLVNPRTSTKAHSYKIPDQEIDPEFPQYCYAVSQVHYSPDSASQNRNNYSISGYAIGYIYDE